jgi:uncharacterized protein (TIGR03067 family)
MIRLSLFCIPQAALGLLLFSVATSAIAPGADDKPDDTKRLQGAWVIDPDTYKNEKDKELVKEAKAVRVIFEGDSFTIKHPPGNEEQGRFRLDPGKKPKTIDLLGKMGELLAEGIYELEGDNLKVCWDRQYKTRGRPGKFARGKDGDEPLLLVLKREKK